MFAVMKCASCGLDISDDSRFCSWCGSRNQSVPLFVSPLRAPAAAIAPSPAPIATAAVPVLHMATPPVQRVAVVPAVPSAIPTPPAILTRAAAVLAVTQAAVAPPAAGVAVPIARMAENHPRLSFCNRCGTKIVPGTAQAYRGLVMCSDCYAVEPIPAHKNAPLTYTIIPTFLPSPDAALTPRLISEAPLWINT